MREFTNDIDPLKNLIAKSIDPDPNKRSSLNEVESQLRELAKNGYTPPSLPEDQVERLF